MSLFQRHFTTARTKFEIEASAIAGKGIIAKKDITIKEEALEIMGPLVVALDTPRLLDTCYNCHTGNERVWRGMYVDLIAEDTGTLSSEQLTEDDPRNLSLCPGCGIVRFCDKTCQKRALADNHKYECPIFAKLAPRILPNNVRAILRILVLRKNGRIPQNLWNELIDLKPHYNRLQDVGGDRWEHLCLMAKAAKEYSGTKETEDFVLRLFCRLLTNGVPLTNKTFEPIGLALDPIIARLNHSCDYNATLRFSSYAYAVGIAVIPLRPIAANEEIKISYIDATMPLQRRKEELHERYFFKCRCGLCKEGINGAPDQFAISGLSKSIRYSIVPTVERQAIDLLEAAIKDDTISGPIQKLKYGLHLLAVTGVWPVHRHPLPALRHQLVMLYLNARQFHLGFVQAIVQYRRIDPVIMAEESHPLRMAHAWVLSRLIGFILDGSYWASQKSEIHDRNVKLHWLQWDVIRSLKAQADRISQGSELHRMICHQHSSNPGRWKWTKGPEHMKLAWDAVEELIDETLEEEKQW